MVSTDPIRAHVESRRDAWLEELFEFLRIPSVSVDPARSDRVREAADWLLASLLQSGCTEGEIWETAGHPVVYAAWRGAPDAPTVLVYGHYDVQPEDPVELWDSPPFDPEIREGRVWGRGTVDDKGQLFIHAKALETWLATRGDCPVNLVYLIEGEEECGSPNVGPLVRERIDKLRCDAVMVSDTSMFAPGLPTLCNGLRGLTYLQVNVRGPAGDLHSGSFGGAVVNPAEALSRMLASCRDPETGRVTIPGFYDDVAEVPAQEREAWSKLPFDEVEYRASLDVEALADGPGATPLERLWAQPAFDVNGFLSGWTGEGSKTVIPSQAMAKVSMRLVADQDPATIADAFEAYMHAVAPPGIRVDVTRMHNGKPWHASREHPVLQAASRAMARGFGGDPVFVREGGSIPLVGTLEDMLGVPTVLMGIGLPDENAHAPNENLDLGNFFDGIASAAYFHEELASNDKAG